LRPDVTIKQSGARVIGGLKLQINLAPNAATDGDVWVYDRESGVAAVGDLVTVPAPFLDTACVKGWEAALDRVWSTPFTTVIPGHGAPMTRAQFGAYRTAFKALADCAASKRDKADCAAAWTTATASVRGDDPREARLAKGMTQYYVQDVLRAHAGNSEWCKRP
jgi:glyoxylase-like metal-dependent hydrolase (beta-lactamase superfamily II)